MALDPTREFASPIRRAVGPDRLTPYLQPLGNLEGRRTLAALVRDGLGLSEACRRWDATVCARVRGWLAGNDLLDDDGKTPPARVPDGHEVLAIAGCSL